MTIIDAHTHVFPQYADLAVAVMDRCGIDCVVTLAWHDGFGAGLQRQLRAFDAYPGRFVVFGNVDWSRINEPSFGTAAALQVAQDVRAGMRGLKVYKALGLEYRHPDGSFWRVNDPPLDPIWTKAAELGTPVLIHTADPAPFWEPMNELNFWNGVVYGAYAWWAYYGKNVPGHQELLSDRNEMIARHPETTFICPHVGSRADCLDHAADDLRRLPNLYYDISARIPTLGRDLRRAAHAREFTITWQDRILLGTDIIYDDTNVPTGIQAQALFQPWELPLGGADPHQRYVETTVSFFDSYIRFLKTSEVQTSPPFKRNRDGFVIHGLDLPDAVCEKVLWANAARLLGLDIAACGTL